jgi:DNA-directed RNA polymerase subunit RPC12/RpoP
METASDKALWPVGPPAAAPARPGTPGPVVECPQCGAPVDLPAYADGAVCGFCGSTLARLRPITQTTKAETPGGERQALRSVRCAQCAGPLDAFEGRRILVCEHCGVRVAVLEHGGFSRWHFPCRLTRLQAAEAGAGWLADYPGIVEEVRTARLAEARLIYAPIWEHKALIAGWEFGYKLQAKNVLVHVDTPSVFAGEQERLEMQMIKEDARQPHLQERRFFQAATDFGVFGATRPRITGRELVVPMLAGEIESTAGVLETQVDGREVAEAGRRVALLPVSGSFATDTHLFCLRESTALLYYPMWLLRYERGNRTARIVINGRDGSINAGVAPASTRPQVVLLAARVAGLAALAVVSAWLAVAWREGRNSMLALAVIVSVAAILMVWRFRPVREVEYREPFSS